MSSSRICGNCTHFAECRGVRNTDTPEMMFCHAFTLDTTKIEGNTDMGIPTPPSFAAPAAPASAPSAPAAPAAPSAPQQFASAAPMPAPAPAPAPTGAVPTPPESPFTGVGGMAAPAPMAAPAAPAPVPSASAAPAAPAAPSAPEVPAMPAEAPVEAPVVSVAPTVPAAPSETPDAEMPVPSAQVSEGKYNTGNQEVDDLLNLDLEGYKAAEKKSYIATVEQTRDSWYQFMQSDVPTMEQLEHAKRVVDACSDRLEELSAAKAPAKRGRKPSGTLPKAPDVSKMTPPEEASAAPAPEKAEHAEAPAPVGEGSVHRQELPNAHPEHACSCGIRPMDRATADMKAALDGFILSSAKELVSACRDGKHDVAAGCVESIIFAQRMYGVLDGANIPAQDCRG